MRCSEDIKGDLFPVQQRRSLYSFAEARMDTWHQHCTMSAQGAMQKTSLQSTVAVFATAGSADASNDAAVVVE